MNTPQILCAFTRLPRAAFRTTFQALLSLALWRAKFYGARAIGSVGT